MASRRNWQFFFSLGYVALFLYLFVARAAPEQKLQADIGIRAPADEVASVLNTGRRSETLAQPAAQCPLAIARRPACLALQGQNWVTRLLARAEHTKISIQPQGSGSLLTVEVRWQVRGGLLGQALDTVIGRRARVHSLTATLWRVKALAEKQRLA